MTSDSEASLAFDPIAEASRRWGELWPEKDTMAAATSLIRVQRIVMSAVDRALEPHGLTFARYEVLILLSFARRGRLPLGKIGARLQVHPTSVTNAIDRLEKQGYVSRQVDATDRRLVLAEITPAGVSIARTATDSVVSSRFGLGMLDTADLATLFDVLRRVRGRAGDFPLDPA